MDETPDLKPGIRLAEQHFLTDYPVVVGLRLRFDVLFGRGMIRLEPTIPPLEEIGFYFVNGCAEDDAINSTRTFLELIAVYIQPRDREQILTRVKSDLQALQNGSARQRQLAAQALELVEQME